MDSMLEAYLFEANELMEHLDTILITCEKANAFDADSINEIFRIMHTIKGSSAMMQFESLATTAHKVEDLFYNIRENGLEQQDTEALFDLVFRATDSIKAEIAKVENGQPLTSDIGTIEQDINDLLKKMSSENENSSQTAVQPEKQDASGERIAPETRPSDSQSVLAMEDPAYPYGVRVFFDEEAQMENLRAFMLVKNLTEVYADFEYAPKAIQDSSESTPEIIKNGFCIFFKRKNDRDEALKIIEEFTYTRNYSTMDKAETASEAAPNGKAAAKAKTVSRQQGEAHGAVKQNLINVNLSKLDSLMDIMGEIVITESMVTAHAGLLDGEEGNNFAKASRQLRKLTDELQEIVMSIRMVPIAGVFQKMNRIVRDMSKNLGKDVRLVMIGEDTEVDKTIVDNIADPLMHVVRNSMDHGIEAPEARLKAGKPAQGTITLSAMNTGGEIIITVADDGEGIDREKVLAKAKRLGLLTKPEEDYTSREIYSLLLVPGFSTNEVVTEYSGRGVGMDVVLQNTLKIGGDVIMDSETGKGTLTQFKIPLTLAIVNGMKVSVGDTVFTIPINNIRQSFKIGQDSILYDTEGNEIIKVRGKYYRLIRLYKALEIDTPVQDVESGIVIMVETHEKVYCILADVLLGEQQVVVKAMPTYLLQFGIKKAGISGCAILGDGSISLIMDIDNLYNNN